MNCMKYGCPNENCKFYNKTNSIMRNGSYRRFNDARDIPRYKCSECGRRFSAATYSLAKGQKKRRVNYPLFKLLVSGVSMRRSSLILGIHRRTVKRKLIYWSSYARDRQQSLLEKIHQKVEHVQFDDLITAEHSKLKPLTVTIAVEKKSRFILGLEVGKIPAFGLLAEKARKKYGYRPNEHRQTINRLFVKIKRAINSATLIESDEHVLYHQIVKKHFPKAFHVQHKGERGAIVGQGELKKVQFDPLFSLNHTCAMLRANINRLFRRTWCTTKDPDMLKRHLDIYTYFHNSTLITKNI